MALNSLPVSGTIADGNSSVTVTLSSGVPENQSVPILSCQKTGSTGTDAREIAYTATLQTVVGGEYTELLLERTSGTSGALEISGHILYGPDLTVQMVSGTITDPATSTTETVTAVTLSEAFIIGYNRGGGTSPGRMLLKFNFTDTTTVQIEKGQSSGSPTYVIYVVEWSGATVKEYDDIQIASGAALEFQTLSPAVTLANCWWHMSYKVDSSGTSPDDNYIEGRLTSTTNFSIIRNAAPTWTITACLYVIEHPDLTVEQTDQTAFTGTSGSVALTGTFSDTTARFIGPGTMLGNARNDDVSGGEHDRVAVKHTWGSSTQINFGRGDGGDTTTVTSQAITLASGPDPAVISREPADIAAQEQTDTTAHIRVDSVDETAGNGHALYGSATNHGSDDAAWEAATLVDGSVAANDLVAESGLTPNSVRYYAVVSTPTSGDKTVSNVLSITTAYARPTAPVIVSKTANSVIVSATDASGDLAAHKVFVRESADPLSALEFKGVIPAGEVIQWEFVDLPTGVEHSFEFVAWDGVDGAAARISGLTAITATPGLAVPIFAHHYRQMAVA